MAPMSRFLAIGLAVGGLFGCTSADGLAPPVGDCLGPECTPLGSAGDAGSSPRECDGLNDAGSASTLSGTVAVLSTKEISVGTSPVRYSALDAFDGTARVEIEGDPCGVATAQVDEMANFTVGPVQVGVDANHLHIVPLESVLELVPTVHRVAASAQSVGSVPLVPAKLMEEFATYAGETFDPKLGHIIVKFVGVNGQGVAGYKVSGPGGVRGYDSLDETTGTGPDGIAVFINLDVSEYPGDSILLDVNDVDERRIQVAAGAVTLALFGA